MNKKVKVLLFSIILFFIFFIPFILALYDHKWYDMLNKPAFSPPIILFQIVWSIIFILISISSSLTIKTKYTEKRFYLILLLLNFVFIEMNIYILFKLKDILLAFIDTLLILITSYMLYLTGKKINSKASYLLIPFILWVIFLAFFQVGIYKIN